MIDFPIYKAFQKPFLPYSLRGKIMLVAFVGTHVPLLGILIYFLSARQSFADNIGIILITLGATVLGMAATLWILSGLLKPVHAITQAITNFKENSTLPDFPTEYCDETGQFMAEVQNSLEKIDELIALKNDLISITSHDLKSPINAIMLANEFISDEVAQQNLQNESIEENSEIIQESAYHQLELIDELINSSKIESSDFKFSPEAISLENVIQDLSSINSQQSKAKNIVFNINLNGCGSCILYADLPKLKSVLNNLINNAIKFTPPGGTVSLEAKVEDDETPGAYFQVRDTGTGIAPQKMDQIWTRSYTTRSPHSSLPGSGLGLWICKKFIDLHKGSINAKSVQDKGSVFTVQIPNNVPDKVLN